MGQTVKTVDMGQVGAAIKRERKRQGISSKRLAAIAGIGHTSLANLEQGRGGQGTTFVNIVKLATCLGIDLSELATGATGEMPPAALEFLATPTGLSLSEDEDRQVKALARSDANRDLGTDFYYAFVAMRRRYFEPLDLRRQLDLNRKYDPENGDS